MSRRDRIEAEFLAKLELGELPLADEKLAVRALWRGAGLSVVGDDRDGRVPRPDIAVADLHGGVAVAVGALDLRHDARPDLDRRHGNAHAVAGEDAGHPDLFAQQSQSHGFAACNPIEKAGRSERPAMVNPTP